MISYLGTPPKKPKVNDKKQVLSALAFFYLNIYDTPF